MRFSWSKETYAASVSSRCWWFTPYDDGWSDALAADDELRAIVESEAQLGPIPSWAQQLVAGPIRFVPPCGHHRFPQAYLEVLDAIRTREVPPLVHSCFTVAPERKARIADLCLCLDAWLAGAGPEDPAVELSARAAASAPGAVDAALLCRDLWHVLGDHTEAKDLLVERTLLQLRWWLKTTLWDQDRADIFGRDTYLGPYRHGGAFAIDNGNAHVNAPGFSLADSPRVRKIHARLGELLPREHLKYFLACIADASWPCAPKMLRFLEGLLYSIGRGRPAVSLPSFPLPGAAPVPSFLQASETYVDQDAAAAWWAAFMAALRGWWQEQPAAGPVAAEVDRRLGQDKTPLARWLVRLYAHRIHRLATQDEGLGRLVRPAPGRTRGTAPVIM